MEALKSDDTSHKGKKMRKYSLDLKKQVIAYAEEHGNRPASRHFEVNERRIREWRTKKSEIVKLDAMNKGKDRSKLSGGGRKPLNTELEEILMEWIDSRRASGLHVSCKLIMSKAEITYRSMKAGNSEDVREFKASKGWLTRFMKRKGLSLSKKTSVAQQDPERLQLDIVDEPDTNIVDEPDTNPLQCKESTPNSDVDETYPTMVTVRLLSSDREGDGDIDIL